MFNNNNMFVDYSFNNSFNLYLHSATASYMALPYLSSVQNFCDNTEELMHDSDLPNKQNLFCDGQSTWEVILTSPDFANNNNPADDSISNTVPEFITIGRDVKGFLRKEVSCQVN